MSEIQLPQKMDRFWVSKTPLNKILSEASDKSITLNGSEVELVDSSGLSWIKLLEKYAQQKGINFNIDQATDHLQGRLKKWPSSTSEEPSASKKGMLVKVGESAESFYFQFIEALSVLTEMLYWSSLGLFRRRDMRRGVLGEQMYLLGFKAVVIVVLLVFLVGIVIALQSAIFLRQYGAGIYLASMIGWSMVREFGPLMTAIILAGRSGSATTAEIATMVVSEEVDALSTMGVNPVQFIVTPKFWAISITMPLLTAMASFAGILGAFLVSLFYLDIGASLFWSELGKYLHFRDFVSGFTKSMVFAWLIIWIGSYYGFRVSGGAEEVGKETTASVVTAIFVIILADALFSFWL